KFGLGGFRVKPETLFYEEPTFWIVLLYGIFINLQNFGVDQSFVQRYATAKSDREAKFSVWLAALMFPPVSALFFFIGTGLFSLYESSPELLAEVRTQVAETQLIQEGIDVTDAALAERAIELTPPDIGDKVLPHF